MVYVVNAAATTAIGGKVRSNSACTNLERSLHFSITYEINTLPKYFLQSQKIDPVAGFLSKISYLLGSSGAKYYVILAATSCILPNTKVYWVALNLSRNNFQGQRWWCIRVQDSYNRCTDRTRLWNWYWLQQVLMCRRLLSTANLYKKYTWVVTVPATMLWSLHEQ